MKAYKTRTGTLVTKLPLAVFSQESPPDGKYLEVDAHIKNTYWPMQVAEDVKIVKEASIEELVAATAVDAMSPVPTVSVTVKDGTKAKVDFTSAVAAATGIFCAAEAVTARTVAATSGACSAAVAGIQTSVAAAVGDDSVALAKGEGCSAVAAGVRSLAKAATLAAVTGRFSRAEARQVAVATDSGGEAKAKDIAVSIGMQGEAEADVVVVTGYKARGHGRKIAIGLSPTARLSGDEGAMLVFAPGGEVVAVETVGRYQIKPGVAYMLDADERVVLDDRGSHA